MAANNGLWIIVAPALVEKYRSGDQIEIDVEDERIFLNREEFKLPFIDAVFYRNDPEREVSIKVPPFPKFMIELFSYSFVPKDGHLCLTLFLL